MSDNSPFDLANDTEYKNWRDTKLGAYPIGVEELLVPIKDPFHISTIERKEALSRVALYNMAIYQTNCGADPDRNILLSIMKRLGAVSLDHNSEADDMGLTALTPRNKDQFKSTDHEYIPYSHRPVSWHTDGYYNSFDRQIYALSLHCVQQASVGGENELMDHEIMYILLRDGNPDYIRALSLPDAMTIPKREEKGVVVRPDRAGPVFSINPANDRLHMRYTHRTKSIVWNEDPAVAKAVAALKSILASASPYIIRGKLEPGMGLVCANVLHTRDGFEPAKISADERLLYRARFLDTISSPA